MDNFDSLLSHVDCLMNHVFWFHQDFNIPPSKKHIGTAINYTDINERRADFLSELINTVGNWVYSKDLTQKIVSERLAQVNNDYANAYSFLTNQAMSKFRPGHAQGQFGELLLFNFLQHFFRAAPLLRKQRILTSTGHERFGADAVHLKVEEKKNIFFLGESKCYTSKYGFKKAFEVSLASIQNTFASFNSELNLYTYDDFVEPELTSIAKSYKMGTLPNVHFELVCLVAYHETTKLSGKNESEYRESIKHTISESCKKIEDSTFHRIEPAQLDRINYILFPIWKFDELIDEFSNNVGSKR